MKKIKLLLLSLICLISVKAKSQTYQPIIDKNSNIQFEVCHPIFDWIESEIYFYSGDTIIDNLEYSIISSSGFVGFLRQDSINSRAWFKEPNQPEKLILDLNLIVGDSIFIDCDMYGRRYSKVVKVDTINNRKVIELDYLYPETYITQNEPWIQRPLKFIEGIGTTGFLIYQIEDLEFHLYGFILREVIKDNEVLITEFEDCFDLVTVSTKNLQQVQIGIYPNPVTNYITIENPNHLKIENVKLYNSYGHFLQEFEYLEGDKIDVSHLKTGLYIINLLGSGRIINNSLVKI